MSRATTTRISLSRKLLLLGALPAVVMFIVLMVFFTSVRLEDARRDLMASGQMLADSLAPALEYPVVSGNSIALEQILSQSLKYSNAAWVRVTDVMGEEIGMVRATSEPPPVEAGDYLTFEAEILQVPLKIGANDANEWFAPEFGFDSGALRVGTIEVGVSTLALQARQQEILWTSIAVGSSLLLFTVLVVRHFLGNILSPIQALSERIDRLINRDYAKAVSRTSGSSRDINLIENKLNKLAEHLATLKANHDQVLAASESAREKAVAANQAKSEFLATMSHELRTPLNGVLGMVDLIEEEPLSSRQRDYLTTARQSTEDLLTVISDILDYAQMDGGEIRLENREFDLCNVINNCAASYRHQAEQHGLSLSVELYGEWPEKALVVGDAGRMRQIIAGLLDNAIKFTSEGTITVRAGCFPLEENTIVLNCAVNDSGTGMPAERMHDIFNSFEQLDSGSTRRYGGTGLGLSLVQRLVELMGGHIQVESDLGQGSSFRFELPFELGPTVISGATRKAASARSPDEGVSHALVVEDNPVNQRVASAMLNRLGFRTDTAANGEEAVNIVQRNHTGYDLILMDCQMPVMDGYEATRRIREWERSNGQQGIPIIALTADVLPATESICLGSGMNDFLAKPVRKENLQEVLGRWTVIREE
ncbi:signal transduction histidine kinase [Marinobacter pelagius]|uniref:histidine kinase n=1 Tax=Marinobacter pelagius TaxID=379482 RepID=A0A366GJ51_9GAMM|nr:ATP-binding protein [Marinobacter pelagius]RBP27104.1 signal transduction histidine kinase [Marinobacter pelagius]